MISNFIIYRWTIYKKSVSAHFQWNRWGTCYLLNKIDGVPVTGSPCGFRTDNRSIKQFEIVNKNHQNRTKKFIYLSILGCLEQFLSISKVVAEALIPQSAGLQLIINSYSSITCRQHRFKRRYTGVPGILRGRRIKGRVALLANRHFWDSDGFRVQLLVPVNSNFTKPLVKRVNHQIS